MTKPSYEELAMNRREAFLRGYEAGKRETFDEMKSLASEDDGKISELESELARVRGLLQRYEEALRKYASVRGWYQGGKKSGVTSYAWAEDALAESADIGKLDTAEERWKRDIPPSEIWACNGCGEEYRVGTKCDLCAGSAETGGEKATPLLHKPNDKPTRCYCPPDQCNAPVIMGRQTPCLRAGSREPEKLNNTQKVCNRCGLVESYHPLWGGTNGSLLHCHKFIESVALAESSLSSPPPEEK